jgi:hypothetical protein
MFWRLGLSAASCRASGLASICRKRPLTADLIRRLDSYAGRLTGRITDVLNHTHGLDNSASNDLPCTASGLMDLPALQAALLQGLPLAMPGGFLNSNTAGG